MATEQTMWVEPYGRGFAIFGESTKEWKENIKAMGGRGNPRLKAPDGSTRFGWIFPSNKESEVREFVEKANSGELQKMSPQVALGPRSRASAPPKMQYQTLTYRVPLPYVGQGVTLSVPEDLDTMLVVQNILPSKPGVVDVISLKDVSTDQEYTGAVVSGVWEILDFGKDHTLTFH